MTSTNQTLIENIIEYARWAPSGDNMQTWRFEIVNDHNFVVNAWDTSDHCVYDLQGHASQLALGALLESINIAASFFACKTNFNLRADDSSPRLLKVDVQVIEDETIVVDPLFPSLPIRSVYRRTLKTTPITFEQKNKLEESIGQFYSVLWIEGFKNRFQVANMMRMNGKLRFTLPEAYPTHKSVIEWNARFSKDKIPDQAVGLDFMATKIMKWALHSWDRAKFLNTYLAGTLLPGIELDLLPGIFCGAHFALLAKQAPQEKGDFISAGRALQRFWLTATEQGITNAA